jgi:hypothetical protein
LGIAYVANRKVVSILMMAIQLAAWRDDGPDIYYVGQNSARKSRRVGFWFLV